jgi:hypothetical protein
LTNQGLCTPAPCASPRKSLKEVYLQFSQAKSKDGIISYPPGKHGENVHEKGIMPETSKSVHCGRAWNTADLTFHSSFCSGDEQGQRICWDFRAMRVQLTLHNPTLTLTLGIMGGSEFARLCILCISRITVGEFPVSTTECRFIRLTETGTNSGGDDFLPIEAFQ